MRLPRPAAAFVARVPMPALRILTIALGGSIGTLARYEVSRSLPTSATGFPWATFAVNIAGSLLIGVVITLVIERFPPTEYVRPFVAIGFCGGFTTFSTFTVEVVQLTQHSRPLVAVVYLFLSVVVGVMAAGLGVLTARERSRSPLFPSRRDSVVDSSSHRIPDPDSELDINPDSDQRRTQ